MLVFPAGPLYIQGNPAGKTSDQLIPRQPLHCDSQSAVEFVCFSVVADIRIFRLQDHRNSDDVRLNHCIV